MSGNFFFWSNVFLNSNPEVLVAHNERFFEVRIKLISGYSNYSPWGYGYRHKTLQELYHILLDFGQVWKNITFITQRMQNQNTSKASYKWKIKDKCKTTMDSTDSNCSQYTKDLDFLYFAKFNVLITSYSQSA